ncbi:unnamed protein product [Mycena citricolor]|uniref:Uncharacterized protein n=1 Tax=Mycena citricolor TaxID=2018698 RepID=A0AAD2H4N2_9AGAR|nr:unnamed protein product [Mycena citricolor]
MIFSWRAGLPLPIPRLPSGSSQASVPISNAGTRTRLVHVDPSQHPEARRVLQPSPTKPKNKSAEPVFPIRASLPISISPSLTHRSSRLRTIPKVSSSSSIDAIQDVWPNKRKTTLPSSPLDCASWKRVRLTDTYPTPPASNRSSASLIELKAQSRRMSLQQQWSDLARNDRGAERVSFVNTVNDEAVPDGLEGFVYLEHSYRLPPQLGSVPCLDLESRELHPATPLTDRDSQTAKKPVMPIRMACSILPITRTRSLWSAILIALAPRHVRIAWLRDPDTSRSRFSAQKSRAGVPGHQCPSNVAVFWGCIQAN